MGRITTGISSLFFKFYKECIVSLNTRDGGEYQYYYPVIAVGTIVRTWEDVKNVYRELDIEIEMDETKCHFVDEFPDVKREINVNGKVIVITIKMMENLDKGDCAGFPYRASDGYFMIGAEVDMEMDPLKEIDVDSVVNIVNATRAILPSARVYSWAASS